MADQQTTPEITDEMRAYSDARTEKHIALVTALGEELGFDFSGHDASKTSPELNDEYVLIDNSYRTDLVPSPPYTQEMADASFAHIKQEPHHPEYWDDTVVENPNFGKESPDVAAIVDATGMTVPAICEMVCDWVAMSIELNSSPIDWAHDQIGDRWSFTGEQVELIFVILHMLWDPSMIISVEEKVNNPDHFEPTSFAKGYDISTGRPIEWVDEAHIYQWGNDQ